MPVEKKKIKWDGQLLTYDEIKERTGLSHNSIWRLAGEGINSTEEALILMQPKPRRTRAEILAEMPKVVSAKSPVLPMPVIQKAPNTVIIQHKELDRMLTYLSKHKGYQAAFDEFMLYIHEGHLWGSESTKAIEQRLCAGHPFEYEEMPEEKPTPMKGWQKQLIPYLEQLEAENENLKAVVERLKSILGEIG